MRPAPALALLALFSITSLAAADALTTREFAAPTGMSFKLAEDVTAGERTVGTVTLKLEGIREEGANKIVSFRLKAIRDGRVERERLLSLTAGQELRGTPDLAVFGIQRVTGSVFKSYLAEPTARLRVEWVSGAQGTNRFAALIPTTQTREQVQNRYNAAQQPYVPAPFRVWLKSVTPEEQNRVIGLLPNNGVATLAFSDLGTGRSDFGTIVTISPPAGSPPITQTVGSRILGRYLYPETGHRWALNEIRWPEDWPTPVLMLPDDLARVSAPFPQGPQVRRLVPGGAVDLTNGARLTLERIDPLAQPAEFENVGRIDVKGVFVVRKEGERDVRLVIGEGDEVLNPYPGFERFAVAFDADSERLNLLVWRAAEPARQQPTFNVEDDTKAFTSKDNVKRVRLTNLPIQSGTQRIVVRGPSFTNSDVQGVQPSECLIFQGGVPAQVSVRDGAGELSLEYQPLCPVCQPGRDNAWPAVMEFEVGLAENPSVTRVVPQAIACEADVLAVTTSSNPATGRGFQPSVARQGLLTYASTLRAEGKSFRLVDLASEASGLFNPGGAALAAAGAGGLAALPQPLFGPRAFTNPDLASFPVTLTVRESDFLRVRFLPSYDMDGAVVRTSVGGEADYSVDGTSENLEGVTSPHEGTVDLLGVESVRVSFVHEHLREAWKRLSIGGVSYRRAFLSESAAPLRVALGLGSERGILLQVEHADADRIDSVKVTVLDAPADLSINPVGEGVNAQQTLWPNGQFKRDQRELGAVTLRQTESGKTAWQQLQEGVSVTLGSQGREAVLFLFASPQSTHQQVTPAFGAYSQLHLSARGHEVSARWGEPKPFAGLEVTPLGLKIENQALKLSLRVKAGGRLVERGTRLLGLNLRAPVKTVTYYLPQDGEAQLDPQLFDDRITRVRAQRLDRPDSTVEVSYNADAVNRQAYRRHAMRAVTRLKRLAKPSAILILGGDDVLPMQRYWDYASKARGGPVLTDDPYAYSSATESSTSLYSITEEDYRIAVGRIPGSPSEVNQRISFASSNQRTTRTVRMDVDLRTDSAHPTAGTWNQPNKLVDAPFLGVIGTPHREVTDAFLHALRGLRSEVQSAGLRISKGEAVMRAKRMAVEEVARGATGEERERLLTSTRARAQALGYYGDPTLDLRGGQGTLRVNYRGAGYVRPLGVVVAGESRELEGDRSAVYTLPAGSQTIRFVLMPRVAQQLQAGTFVGGVPWCEIAFNDQNIRKLVDSEGRVVGYERVGLYSQRASSFYPGEEVPEQVRIEEGRETRLDVYTVCPR